MRSDSRPHTYALGHHGFSGEWASLGFVVHDPYGSERMDLALTGVDGRSDRTSSRTSDGVDRVAADIVEAGGAAIGIVCEVGELDQITAAVDQVVAAYGRIDILVNNAADRSAVLSTILDLSIEQLQRNFDTGAVAYIRFMQFCYPHLKKAGRAGSSISAQWPKRSESQAMAATIWRRRPSARSHARRHANGVLT